MYLPLEKGGAFHLNRLESSSPNDALCQAWLKLAQWFWRRTSLKFCQYIFTLLLLSPLGKGRGHSFEETWIPFTQECFVPSLVWNLWSDSGEEGNVKSSRQRWQQRRQWTRTIYDSGKLTWAFSSSEQIKILQISNFQISNLPKRGFWVLAGDFNLWFF